MILIHTIYNIVEYLNHTKTKAEVAVILANKINGTVTLSLQP